VKRLRDPGGAAVDEIVGEVREAEWRDYVESATRNLTFTPEWTRFLEGTFAFRRHHLFALDRTGAVTGFLPLFRVASRLTGDRLSAVPFSSQCGPLGGDEARTALLSAACRLKDDIGAGTLEIRDEISAEGFRTFNWYSTYLLDLTPGPEFLRTQRFNKSIQRGIAQAEKQEVEVTRSGKPEDIATFYHMNLLHKRDLGVLCHPRRFFENLFSLIPGCPTLYLARYRGEPLAGCIMLRFRDHLVYGYGASSHSSRNIAATKLILWESIRDACSFGVRSFDLGRVSYDNTGLIQFKKGWGAREEKLHYSYYPAPAGTLSHRRDTLPFRTASAAVRIMPVPLFTRLSDHYFGIFG